MFSTGIISQHFLKIWPHLWWEPIWLSFHFLPCIVNCKTDLYPLIFFFFFAMRFYSFFHQGVESLFPYFVNLDLDMWQMLANGTLENLIQTEAWQMMENWGFISLASLRDSVYHFVNEPQLIEGCMAHSLTTPSDPRANYSSSGIWLRP